jgi:hypothetical protein
VQSPDLVRYLAEFELALSDLRPEQVAMFVAARNAAPYVRNLEVPIAVRRDDRSEPTLAQQDADRVLDLIAYDDAAIQSHLPADEMDVSSIRGVEDLSRIFPVEWLLEGLQPDVFYAKLARHELLMPDWQRPAQGKRESADEPPQREVVDAPASDPVAKQHAYVLLDTSGTMQDRDRRGTVARGLALEFLRAGHDQGAQLNLRPFTEEVGTLSSGAGRDDFRALARRIIELPNAGQTRIGAALEQAVLDIRSAGPCRGADIMLITDGISRLLGNPLAEEKLHTFLLGDLFEDHAQGATIAKLKSWSRTFHRIWQNRFAEILAPSLRDCQAAAEVLEAALEHYRSGTPQADPDSLRQLIENVRFLVSEYQRSLDKTALPAEAQAIQGQLIAAEYAIKDAAGAAPGQASAADDREFATPDSPTLAHGHGAKGSLQGLAALWRYLRNLAVRAWAWTCRQCRAIGGRGR